MREFGSFQFDPRGYVDGGQDQFVRNTPAYIELVRKGYGEPAFYFTSYSLRVAPHSFFVMTSWGNLFDEAFSPLASDSRRVASFARELINTKPLLADIVANTIQDHPRGSVGVLTKLEDPDNGDPIWALGRVLGNYAPTDLNDPRQTRMHDDVVNLSRHIYLEWFQSPTVVAQPERAQGTERTIKLIKDVGPRLLEVAFGELLTSIFEG